MDHSSSLNWLFWMDVHVISIAESSHWYQMTDVDRQNKLGFSASAAGRFIFLGSSAAFFNAGSVTGSGEMENVSVELFFCTLDEAAYILQQLSSDAANGIFMTHFMDTPTTRNLFQPEMLDAICSFRATWFYYSSEFSLDYNHGFLDFHD